MSKYQSVTTPEVQHDSTNFLTEIFFLNKYGALPQYPWRKEYSFSKEWGKTVSLFRKLIKTHHIKSEQIAWYLHTYLPKKIDAKSFGLMVWKIKTLFKHISLSYLQSLYTEKFKIIIDKSHLNIKDNFNLPSLKETQEGGDLFSILKDLENIHAEKNPDNRDTDR